MNRTIIVTSNDTRINEREIEFMNEKIVDDSKVPVAMNFNARYTGLWDLF